MTNSPNSKLPKNAPIRILVVDDHFAVRMGLAASIKMDRGMDVVAEAGNARQALEQYRKHQPDVVLMDLRLPAVGGDEATASLRREFPQARVIVFSSYGGDENVRRSLEAGARAYLFKSSPRAELLEAIRKVHSGDVYLPRDVAAELARHVSRPGLTERELEVLRLIIGGRSNKEIASELAISEITVKRHCGHLFQKLGVNDRTQAATEAIQRGIIQLD